ncbi:MAG TPA: SMP-30/gluconolactonase/LRE family protein [Chroococcales cyanobacterium]
MKELVAEPILQARAKLGEGSIWNAEQGVLHWVDIDSFLIHTFDPSTGVDRAIDVGNYVSTVVRRSAAYGGGFMVGLGRSFAHVSDAGVITMVCEVEPLATNRLNDGKCDPSGRFFCGSMAFDLRPQAGGLWILDLKQKAHQVLSDVTCSNGLVWTADARVMYYIDTGLNRLDAFDYDVETGAMTNRRPVLKNTFGGHFDGMTIDSDDNLYICAWQGGAVYKIDPRNGDLLARITVPGVKNVTSCAFGGARLSDLYITSASENADVNEEPNAGALFKVVLSDAQGVPAFEYQG